MKYVWTILLAMSLMSVLLGCQPARSSTQVSEPENTAAQTDIPGSVPQSGATQDLAPLLTSEATEMVSLVPLNESSEKMITLVKQHLAQNLGIAVDQIVVSDVKSVRWRDAGLGCPKLGVDYIQVETPGYSIFLQADGKTYNYHTDEVKRFVLCKS